MFTLQGIKDTLRMFRYSKFKINEIYDTNTVEIIIYSFKRLNKEQKQHIYWNKPMDCKFLFKIKTPLLKFTIQSLEI